MTLNQFIRSLQPDDLPYIKAVIDACGLFPSEMLDGMTEKYFLGEAGTEIWLTMVQSHPVGVAYCAPELMTEGTWNLLLIAVHPESQHQGYGGDIIRSVEQLLSLKGQRLLLVETSSLSAFENTRAFYRKLGFHEEARIRDFYRAGEDKIVYRKLIDSEESH